MTDETIADQLQNEKEGEAPAHHAPGTAVLVIILLVTFAVYYFANWKALADVWHVR
jgi:cytochrome c oxidase subunit I